MLVAAAVAAAAAGLNEISKLIVRPRGSVEELGDDRIDEMRSALEQLTGDKGTVVFFEEQVRTPTHARGAVVPRGLARLARAKWARVVWWRVPACTQDVEEEIRHLEEGAGVLEVQAIGEVHTNGATKLITAILMELGLCVACPHTPHSVPPAPICFAAGGHSSHCGVGVCVVGMGATLYRCVASGEGVTSLQTVKGTSRRIGTASW